MNRNTYSEYYAMDKTELNSDYMLVSNALKIQTTKLYMAVEPINIQTPFYTMPEKADSDQDNLCTIDFLWHLNFSLPTKINLFILESIPRYNNDELANKAR